MNPMRILVRLRLNWTFVEIISRFCATLSAIACTIFKRRRAPSFENWLGKDSARTWTNGANDVELHVSRMPFEHVFWELPYTNDVELYDLWDCVPFFLVDLLKSQLHVILMSPKWRGADLLKETLWSGKVSYIKMTWSWIPLHYNDVEPTSSKVSSTSF